MKKEKKQKNKVPFYAKPFQKILEKSTYMTLSHLYEFSKENYSESLSYDDWLVAVREFMSKEVKL